MLEHLIHVNTWFHKFDAKTAEQQYFRVFVREHLHLHLHLLHSPPPLGGEINTNTNDILNECERNERREGRRICSLVFLSHPQILLLQFFISLIVPCLCLSPFFNALHFIFIAFDVM